MINITCQLETYGEKQTSCIKVNNDWNNDNLVEIEIDGVKRVVNGRELIEAVRNCMNTCRH